MFEPVSSLALRPVIPPAGRIKNGAGIRPVIDGRDVLAESHPEGDSSLYHERWFGPPETWPLWVGEEPHRIELSNNDCDTGCCGGVFVTIQRLGPLVEWTDWENTSDVLAPVPPEIHFDAAQYDAELARLVADHTWEQPVDTAARLLAQHVNTSDWCTRWTCEPFTAGIRVNVRGTSPEVIMSFMNDGFGPGGRHRWFTLPVTSGEPVRDQVRRFIARITEADPRDIAKGS
ncbi:hypothetical protein ABT160_23275 [Streptomyces sp. NPDC001941]|uniref:hypothetical protein n=1 Tax=Streptomyces sp. NPDC001941 TaxID=3154659 RepID=UPI00331689D4